MFKRSFLMPYGFEIAIEDIQKWQEETFPGVTPQAAFERLEDELNELRDELTGHYRGEDALDEVADCMIVLCQIAKAVGGSLPAAVKRKMDKNLNRAWKIGADGTGQHVKEDGEWLSPEP